MTQPYLFDLRPHHDVRFIAWLGSRMLKQFSKHPTDDTFDLPDVSTTWVVRAETMDGDEFQAIGLSPLQAETIERVVQQNFMQQVKRYAAVQQV